MAPHAWPRTFQPRFRIWEALFCPNQLDLHGLAKTEEEQNSAARNYLDLWKKESGFARGAPSGDPSWRVERFCEVSREDRIGRIQWIAFPGPSPSRFLCVL